MRSVRLRDNKNERESEWTPRIIPNTDYHNMVYILMQGASASGCAGCSSQTLTVRRKEAAIDLRGAFLTVVEEKSVFVSSRNV